MVRFLKWFCVHTHLVKNTYLKEILTCLPNLFDEKGMHALGFSTCLEMFHLKILRYLFHLGYRKSWVQTPVLINFDTICSLFSDLIWNGAEVIINSVPG